METRRLLKQRLAVFLSIAMVFTMLLGVTPQMQTTAQAAGTTVNITTNGLTYTWTTDLNGHFLSSGYVFGVEANQTVYLSRMFRVSVIKSNGTGTYYNTLDEVSGVSYSLDSTKAATLNKKTGVLKTKSVGVVQGTIKYKSDEKHFTIQILKPGTLGTNSAKYKTIRSLITKIRKYNKTVTAKNRYDYITNENKYYLEKEKLDLGSDGTRYDKGSYKIGNTTYTYSSLSYLVVPEMAGMDSEFVNLSKYSDKYNPVGTVSGKYFKIKSVNAKKNTKDFNIVLTKKVNADQIFAIKANYCSDTIIKNDKTAQFPIYVVNKKTGQRYYATAVAKEGSNKLTVKMRYMKFNAKDTYQLLSYEYWFRPGVKKYDWTGWKTFKAK